MDTKVNLIAKILSSCRVGNVNVTQKGGNIFTLKSWMGAAKVN